MFGREPAEGFSFRAVRNHMAMTLAAARQAATRRTLPVTVFSGLCALTTTKTAPKIAPTSNPVIRCMTFIELRPGFRPHGGWGENMVGLALPHHAAQIGEHRQHPPVVVRGL